MKKGSYAQVLDDVARKHFPDDANILPKIQARLGQKENYLMTARLKWIWIVLLAALGLGLITTAGYAIYRIFFDPGLSSVRDAGLGVSPNITAQPTILPVKEKPTTQPLLATRLGNEQTSQGLTLRLDWVYLESTHQALGLTLRGSGENFQIGVPQVHFTQGQSDQYRGGLLEMTPQAGDLQGTLILNQLLREGDNENKVSLQVDLPVRKVVNGQESPVTTFHFSLENIPLSSEQAFGSGQVYSARVDGEELRLEFLRLTPQGILADLCYTNPQATLDWHISQAELRVGDPTRPAAVPAAAAKIVNSSSLPSGEQCTDIRFPPQVYSSQDTLTITVRDLVLGQKTAPGPWIFQAQPASRIEIPGIARPTPTPEPTKVSKTVGNLTATLNWAYADAQRVALEIHFEGWKPNFAVIEPTATDENGGQIFLNFFAPSKQVDPATTTLIFAPDEAQRLQAERIHWGIDIPVVLDSDATTVIASFHFDLDLPVYPETVVKPAQNSTAGGLTMRLEQVRMTASYTIVDLCYEKPTRGTASDWMTSADVSLNLGGTEVTTTGYKLLSDRDYGAGGIKGGLTIESDLPRCVSLEFPLGHQERKDPLEMKLVVPQLEESLPEVISDQAVQQANDKLAAEGIQVSYATVSGDGGGGASLTAVKKPAGMDDKEVMRRFYAVLGYYHSGPWEFSLTIQPK